MARDQDQATTEALVEFFRRSGRLKTEPRKGWVKKLGERAPESVADHSYRSALMAMVFSDMRGLDTERAVKMAILHDLPESVVGDSIPGERSRREKVRREDEAMISLLERMPRPIREEYTRLWAEFLEGMSPEAVLVSQIDKLEMAMQAQEYADRGHDPRSLREFFRTARRSVKDRELRRMLLILERGREHGPDGEA